MSIKAGALTFLPPRVEDLRSRSTSGMALGIVAAFLVTRGVQIQPFSNQSIGAESEIFSMPDLSYLFPIKASRKQVFDAISTPAGLNSWWTKTCSGEPVANAEYELGFGPNYDWRGRVLRCIPGSDFELQLVVADQDWKDTRLVFHLSEKDGATEVDFHHRDWPNENEHFRISCYCWAMYLRLLKRYVEFAEVVSYDDRLEV